MTVRLDYSLNNDAQYLLMWTTQQHGPEQGRYFICGPELVFVKRGEIPPDCVKHSVTTLMLVELLDALLAAGLRPSSNAWSAGHVSDLKAHIQFAEHMATALLPKDSSHG